MAVYFNIEKSFNELKLESHKLNLGILHQRTLFEYLRLFNEELKKLLKFDIEQIVSADTQRAHKDSERLYRAPDKKSWHGFPANNKLHSRQLLATKYYKIPTAKVNYYFRPHLNTI